MRCSASRRSFAAARARRGERPAPAARKNRKIFQKWNPARLEAFPPDATVEDRIVDKEHIRGAADKAKGAVKDAAGKITGDKEMQAEGKVDKAKGEAHRAAGDIKDAARDAKRQADKR